MKKLVEHTYGNHIYMKLELDGKIEEVDNYPGAGNDWTLYKTTSDGDPARRRKVIDAFNKLY